MSTPLSLSMRQARLLATRDHLDVGGGELWFYTLPDPLTIPATPETATTETLLGVIPLAGPSGAIGASGTVATLTLTVPRAAPAGVTGLIGFVRLMDGAGNSHLDLLVGKSGVTYDPPRPVLVSDLQVYSGGELQLLSCVISE